MAYMLPDEVNSERDLTACFFWQLLRLIPNSILHIQMKLYNFPVKDRIER